jgi:hypothetical protein
LAKRKTENQEREKKRGKGKRKIEKRREGYAIIKKNRITNIRVLNEKFE